jgi:hypothetical protein
MAPRSVMSCRQRWGSGAFSVAILMATASCHAKSLPKPSPWVRCLQVGHHVSDRPVSGYVIGGLGSKVAIKECGSEQIGLIFLNKEPSSLTALRARSERLMTVVGFDAVASGWVVEDRGTYTLIVASIDGLNENPSVVESSKRPRKRSVPTLSPEQPLVLQ